MCYAGEDNLRASRIVISTDEALKAFIVLYPENRGTLIPNVSSKGDESGQSMYMIEVA